MHLLSLLGWFLFLLCCLILKWDELASSDKLIGELLLVETDGIIITLMTFVVAFNCYGNDWVRGREENKLWAPGPQQNTERNADPALASGAVRHDELRPLPGTRGNQPLHERALGFFSRHSPINREMQKGFKQIVCCLLSTAVSVWSPLKKKIYIYTFIKRFYLKRLTVHLSYNFFLIRVCVPWEFNRWPFAPLTLCSTTEPQEHQYN